MTKRDMPSDEEGYVDYKLFKAKLKIKALKKEVLGWRRAYSDVVDSYVSGDDTRSCSKCMLSEVDKDGESIHADWFYDYGDPEWDDPNYWLCYKCRGDSLYSTPN